MSIASSLYDGLDLITNRYEMVLLATWREAYNKAVDKTNIHFSKDDFVRHSDVMCCLGLVNETIKNVPDIIYTYRARADLPSEILQYGYFAIIGRDRGQYAFVQIDRPNRLCPPNTMHVERLSNQIPLWARSYLSKDEQGMLTTVNANNIVGHYLDLAKCFRIQSHLRIGVRAYGQVEVDELYIGETWDGKQIGIAVEAKDHSKNDCLNVSQLFGTSQAVKQVFPHITQKVLGIKPYTNKICVCEFGVCNNVRTLKEVRPWRAYELYCDNPTYIQSCNPSSNS